MILRDNEQVAFIYSDRELSISGDSPIALAIDDYLRK